MLDWPSLEALRFEHVHPPTRIVFGRGAVGSLAQLTRDAGGERALIVCGRTVAAGPQLAAVRHGLGGSLAGVFEAVGRHGDLELLEDGAELAERLKADVLVSVGGGATIDSAKCIALLLARDAELSDYRVPHGPGGLDARLRRLPETTLPHVAVPTTAGSSSEIMPWAGIRDAAAGEKLLFRDVRLIPQIAVLDPEIVAHTGPELTATSGITAVARAVEALYSARRQPIADAYALQAVRLLAEALPRAVEDGSDLDARAATQIGALLSGIAAENAMVSLVHAVGHAVGGRYGLQHGVAHAILLPRVSARCLPVMGARQRDLLDALGGAGEPLSGDWAGRAAVSRIAGLIEGLPVPQRLRDAGVPRDDLPLLADMTMREPMLAASPVDFGRDDVRALLEEVW